MKPQVFALSAVGMLFAVSATSSAPRESQRYARRAYSRAKVLLRAAGLGASPQPASVRARVDGEGSLVGLSVLRSSGCAEIDRALKTVLRRILDIDPPCRLRNGAVTLNIGRDAAAPAAAR